MENSTPVMAIIGSAGRRADAHFLTPALWQYLVEIAKGEVAKCGITSLVSGGAAFADHIAVRLFLDGSVDTLAIETPGFWDGKHFVAMSKTSTMEADYASILAGNYYHTAFQAACGVDSAGDFNRAIAKGAVFTPYPNFKARDRMVAKKATKVLAFTFGKCDYQGPWVSAREAGLKFGGTFYTWNQMSHVDSASHVNIRSRIQTTLGW